MTTFPMATMRPPRVEYVRFDGTNAGEVGAFVGAAQAPEVETDEQGAFVGVDLEQMNYFTPLREGQYLVRYPLRLLSADEFTTGYAPEA